MPSTQGGAGQPARFPASPHAVARKPKGYTSIISILAGRLSNWSLDVRVLLPKISLKRRERDAELVGRMVEGGLCPQRAAGSKSQDCNRGGAGGGGEGRTHVGDGSGQLFAASPDSFFSSVFLFETDLLSRIWKLVATTKIWRVMWFTFCYY